METPKQMGQGSDEAPRQRQQGSETQENVQRGSDDQPRKGEQQGATTKFSDWASI